MAKNKKDIARAPQVGPGSQARQNATRQALLLTALRYFARHGIEGTSINELTRAAKARNKSAIHYHFGGKAGLVDQLVALIQDWFDTARGPVLDALEARRAAGAHVELEAVLRAFVVPYVRLIEDEPWGLDAVRLLARLQLEQNPAGLGSLQRRAGIAANRVAALLASVLSRPLDIAARRAFSHYFDSTINAFATYRRLRTSFLGDLSLSPTELGELLVAVGLRQLGSEPPGAAERVRRRSQLRMRAPEGS